MSKRPKLSETLRNKVVYASAANCAICQKRGAQIHHIDKDNTNNTFDNLVLLCNEHHDEAHTKRELSTNLTPSRIKAIRDQWYDDVNFLRRALITSSGQRALVDDFFRVGVNWGYINHSRLIQSLPKQLLVNANPQLYARLLDAEIIDEQGIFIRPMRYRESSSYLRNTIYDYYDHGSSLSLHIFYSDLVDALVHVANPIQFDKSNSAVPFQLQDLSPGTLFYINQAQYFKKAFETEENAEVNVHTKYDDAKICYQMNTRNMFGTTSITVSFTGHKTATALLQLKSLEDQDGETTLHCSPIALGVGFSVRHDDIFASRTKIENALSRLE